MYRKTVLGIVFVTIFAFLCWRIYAELNASIGNLLRQSELEQLHGEIVYLDEVLTSSARIGIFTNDPNWEILYQESSDRVDRRIDEMLSLVPDFDMGVDLEKAKATRQHLQEWSLQAFQEQKNGNVEKAKALLFSDQYIREKENYSSAMYDIALGLTDEIEKQLIFTMRSFYLLMGITSVYLMTFLFALHFYDTQKTVMEKTKSLQEKLVHAKQMESIGTLAGGIAHDFNNLLNIIFANAKRGRKKSNQPETVQTCMNEIIHSVKRGTELVKQFLNYRHSDQAYQSAVDLEKEVTLILNTIESSMPNHVSLSKYIEKTGTVLSSHISIFQILSNLFSNSIDSMEKRKTGLIQVSLHPYQTKEILSKTTPPLPAGEYAKLTFKDNGHGMPPETLGKIFDPYFTTKDVDKGTGLGLYSLYGQIKKMGGGVLVSSSPNQGTTFEIYIPRKKDDNNTIS